MKILYWEMILTALEDKEEFEEAVEEVIMKDCSFDGQTLSGSKSACSLISLRTRA